MAEAYRIQERHDLAIQEWEAALKMEPDDRRLRKGLARALWLNRDYRKAQPLLEELLRLEPDSPDLNFQLGDTLLHGETPEKAIPYLEKAVQLSPAHLPARAALGQAYGRVGRPEEAVAHLKAALEIDADGSLYYQLGQAYQKSGQTLLARRAMERFEEISQAARQRRRQLPEAFEITPP